MKTLDVLRHPLNGSTLIEASAGTGKTFTIALLYVRLVLGHGQAEGAPLSQGVLPPNLLVVTFTEAATKELRERIRQRLTEAADIFADSILEDSKNALLFAMRNEYSKEQWPVKRQQLLQAIEWMDEAAVSTIHSWCYRMLSEHAFDSGNLFDIELIADQDPLYQQVVQDYWRSQIYPLPDSEARTVLELFKTPKDLALALRGLLDKIELIDKRFNSISQAIEAANQEFEDNQQSLVAEAQKLKQQDWSYYETLVKDTLGEHAKSLELTRKKSAMLKAWSAIQEWTSNDQLLPEGLANKGLSNHRPDEFKQHLTEKLSADSLTYALTIMQQLSPALTAIESIYALQESIKNWQDPSRGYLLTHAISWIHARLRLEKQQRVEMGFDDLLDSLDAALSGERSEALTSKLRAQFPVALIDEFQDTDPTQYRIFERIYRVSQNDPASCFLMIGDPKQAIYGFRGGDIHTYMRARSDVAERNYTLDTNFRSDVNMVSAVNALFEHGDNSSEGGAFSIGPDVESRLPFHPVNAQGTERVFRVEGDNSAALNIRSLDTLDKNGEFKAAAGNERDRIASGCATEIVRLLHLGQKKQAGFSSLKDPKDINPLSPGDVAVLVNDWKEAAAVRGALAMRGVKSVFLSDRDSVLESAVAVQILHWLRAFSTPQHVSYLRAALATPVMGYSWQALDALVCDELILEAEIERFFGYRKLWQRQGILPAIRAFLMQQNLPARLLSQIDGERSLTDILHIAELLQEEAVRLDGEQALVHHYQTLLQNQVGNSHHASLRLESDAHLVQVITVHKSKGLEYPLVFIPFGTAIPYYWDKAEFLSYRDAAGEPRLSLTPDDRIRDAADRERLSEDVRKLYVALTRARYATWLGVATVKNWHMSAVAYLFGGKPLADRPFSEALSSFVSSHQTIDLSEFEDSDLSVYQPDAPSALGESLRALRDLRSNWWIASYSRITYLNEYTNSPAFSDSILSDSPIDDARSFNLKEEPDDSVSQEIRTIDQNSYHAFPRGGVAGDLLHSLLEWSAEQGFAKVLEDSSKLAELISTRTLPRGWSAYNQMLLEWVLDIVRTPFALPCGEHVSLADLNHVKAEMEFWFETNQLSVAELDRLVCEKSLSGQSRPRAAEAEFNGMLKGFIDLLFEHRGKYYVLDYKSTTLGEDDSDYNLTKMTHMMLKKRYDMQYLIYLVALNRLLGQRMPDYDYDEHIGGTVYLFIRGVKAPSVGAFNDKPDSALIHAMDALFSGESLASLTQLSDTSDHQSLSFDTDGVKGEAHD